MISQLSKRARQRIARLVVGVFAAVALIVALPGTALALDETTATWQLGDQWQERSTSPLSADYISMSRNQAKMNLGQQDTIRYDVYFNREGAKDRSGTLCGTLVFQVTRYQAYHLYWQNQDGKKITFLYRGGLVADANRPYVGVFFLPGGKLVIQTYGYSNGKIVNPWVAASATSPVSGRLVLNGDGLWASPAAGGKITRFLTGQSSCVRY